MPQPEEYQIIFSYAAIVPAKKSNPELQISSKFLSHSEGGYTYFYKLFLQANKHCKTAIIFNGNDNQTNEIRSILLNIIETNDQDTKKRNADLLAERLASVTDERNKEGLFVIMEGRYDEQRRIMLVRLKGDEGVVRRMGRDTFELDMPEDIYTARSKFFKAALFEDEISDRSFWNGLAVDKQLGISNPKEISDYWIKHFLQAQLSITDKNGTSLLAKTFRELLRKKLDIREKNQIISSIVNLRNREDKRITLNNIADNLLTGELGNLFKELIQDERLLNTPFEIDTTVYDSILGEEVIQFDNGSIVITPTFNKPENYEERELEGEITEIKIRGKVTDRNLKRGRS